MRRVNGRQLYRLARRLTELSRQADIAPGDRLPSPGEMAILGEVAEYPGCSIRQLCERTGFVQSHVSTIVAGLAERGLLVTDTDPADRRRTLVHPGEQLTRGIDRRRRPIDDTLASALGDPAAARRAAALLEELATLLLDEHRPTVAPRPSTPTDRKDRP
ncbi:MarR family winged helix-turn-helix transcriptional regulator [Nocardia sputorum]|uniref:MarR family winged helix-turn-helix transcriptional regulator n=1 Tax=Nocardia sputorum TaxID=2984338 RepID=UPI0024935EC9|nr:helix-turn-helix domain-containing protein [Nocardia sputorum]